MVTISGSCQPVRQTLALILILVSGWTISQPHGWANPVQDEATEQPPTAQETAAQDPDDQPPAEIELSFRFNKQPWEDVLNWFARQANLSLVVDQLPPGDFTFSDSRTYSPRESIDLLNSVLMTKGFTLVRKENMLIVLNTSDGVPYDLIPQESVDGLKQRGRFELVTVSFALEGRPLDTVENEIQPLIGPLGRVYPMPATGQIQVTETAGKMSAINALIQSIPKPKPPRKPEPKPKAPPQVLKPYAVKDLDLAPTTELLNRAVGGIRATADETSNQIFIYATEEQHGAVDRVLETLRGNPQPDQIQVKTYPYQTASPDELATQLRTIEPAAVVQVDPTLRRLIVLATDTQQDKIQQALQEIQGPAATPMQLRSYPMVTEDPTQIVATLTEMVPSLKVTPQPEAQRILVIGTSHQQEQAAALLQQFQDEGLLDSNADKQLESFALQHLEPAAALRLLDSMHPLITLQADTENQRLIGYLSPQQTTTVRRSLATLDVAPDAANQPQLQVYPLTSSQYEQLTPLLPQLAPDAKVTWDSKGQRILVVADQQGQQELQKLLEAAANLTDGVPGSQLQVYSVTPEQKTRLNTILPTLPDQFSNLQMLTEPDPRKLTVWAPADEHQALQALLDSLKSAAPSQSMMKAYAVTPEQKTRFTAILPTLQDRLPDVQVIPETDPRRITVWAPESQQQELEKLLGSLQVNDTPETQRILAVYTLNQADPATAQQTLVKLFPDVDIVLEPEAERIVVYATAEQQEKIQAAVRQMDQGTAGSSRQQSIQVYPLKNIDPTTARSAVIALVPDLTITIDAANGSLIVWGKDRDHRELSTLLKQMEATAESGDRTMQVYDTVDQDPVEMSRIIEQLAPRALVSASRRARGVAVWATEEEHSAIGPALKQLVDLENQDQRELRTLDTTHTGAEAASRLLRGVAPEAAFFPAKDDRSLFSYAEPDQQPRIQSVMEQLEQRNSSKTTDLLQAYAYRKNILNAAKPLITARLPQAEWVETGAADQWLVWASREDHQVIDEILQNMDQSMPEGMEQSLGIYVLDKVNPTDAQTTINTIVGTVTYLTSPATDQLRVWATESQHRQITELIQQLQQQVTEASESRPLEIYSIDPKTDVATVYQSLGSELLTGISVVQNPERNALIVRASPEKHEALKKEIDAFLAALPEKIQRTPQVYPLEHVSPEAARQLLLTLIPAATYAVDPTNGNLAATALPEEHQQITAAIEQIDQPSQQPLQTRAYRVPTGYASAIQSSLTPIYPKARISTDFTGSSLVIAATEGEHQEIGKIIEDVVLGTGRGTTSEVYTLRVADPTSVLSVLRQVVPQSQASADPQSGSVVVTATPEEHQKISQLLEDLDVAGKDRTAKVYRLKNASPLAAQQALSQALPRASLTVDRSSNSLIATASPTDHQQIQQTIDQLESTEDQDLETISYTLTGADPRSAQEALESLLPSAQFSADRRAGVLIATASRAQHDRIQAVVDQMENSDTNKPHARAIEIDGGNSERLYSMLSRMYRFDSEVRFTYESTSGTIMFIGPKRQEEAVMELVDQWNAVVKKEQPRDVKVYELMEVDGDAIVDSLDELFEEQSPKPDLQVQWYTNKLIAVATPEQHTLIQQTIEQIRGQQRTLEVFTLVVNSPETVEDAIDQMFIDLPVGGSPSITSSIETQQIFVRATPSQQEEVRGLLLKLGEPADVVQGSEGPTGSTNDPAQGQQGRVRVLSADDADDLLKKLEQVWPQVSPVPLRVMRPDSPNPLPRNPAPKTPPAEESNPLPIRTTIAPPSTSQDQDEAEPDDETPPSQDSQESSTSGLIVVPGNGKLTVASENQEALSLFQELFQVLKQQQAGLGKTEITGNFTVFQLENAGAAEVAASVQRLFQQISSSQSRDRRGQSQSRVSVVPDERLNALIVYGPPNDRRTIEQLLKVLDTQEIPLANNRLNQARIVRVENVEADQVMDVLQSVYRTQLRPDQPPRIQIPAGVSVEVAVALREVNAAAAAPLLTLEVDQATNSIIVLASERLGSEVESLIQRLDQENKEGNTRAIRVIALENANTERIEQALERMLRNRRRSGR